MRLVEHVLARRLRTLTALAALPVLLVAATSDAMAASGRAFVQTNLVSDQPGVALTTDPNLVNAWGLVAGPTSPWWVSDNGTGLSTLYSGAGAIVPLVVTVPVPAGSPAGTVSLPTGVAFNGTSGFVVSTGTASGPAVFIFSTEDGTIAGWSPAVDRTHAILMDDNSAGGSGAVYKGLAIATNSQGQQLILATNFRSGRVDVFDSTFKPVPDQGAFADPFLPAGFAPFGITTIQGRVYVTYARQNATGDGDVPGVGNGFVDVFDGDGRLLHRVASRGVLDSPWGMAIAPAGFGAFAGDLLVGNFGNGRIHAFRLDAGVDEDGDQDEGGLVGTMMRADGGPLVIDGLWALQFGNGAAAGPATTLFFTAGPDGETHGLLGTLLPAG